MENERLFDLVRYARGYLFDAELITQEEFTEILTTQPIESVKRLENYDVISAKLKAKDAEIAAILSENKRLRLALTSIIDDACSYICPSTGKAGTPIPHSERCLKARAVLARGGRS